MTQRTNTILHNCGCLVVCLPFFALQLVLSWHIWKPLFLPFVSATATSATKTTNIPSFYVLNPHEYRSYFPDDASFETAKNVAPFIDLPHDSSSSSLHEDTIRTTVVSRAANNVHRIGKAAEDTNDNHKDTQEEDRRIFQDVMKAYYYRARSYRKHVKKTSDDRYWVVTEFLPNVNWAGPDNTIAAAAGHHILEGRWFWDAPQVLEGYVRFWYLGGKDEDFKVIPKKKDKKNLRSHVSTQMPQVSHQKLAVKISLGDTNPDNNNNRRVQEELDPTSHLSVNVSILEVQQPQPQQQKQAQKPQPQRHISFYTNWIYHAAWQYGQLWGTETTQRLFADTFHHAAKLFREAYVNKHLTNSTMNQRMWNTTSRVCWTQDDGRDAMEVSVSGGGCRPTIASAMWGEATALAKAAKLLGLDQHVQDEFTNWATFSQQVITQQHWNPVTESFAVIAPPKYKTPLYPAATECDLKRTRTPNKPISVRELLAFVPWYYSDLLPLTAASTQNDEAIMWARQFQWLLKSSGTKGFDARWGLRTVERSTPCYNYSWSHGDCWNGPSWPYETSRVLTAVANLLIDHHDKPAVVEASQMTPEEFQRLFVQYAQQHTQTMAVHDTATPKYSGHIFENLHPDDGYWNNRFQMYERNDTNKDMGDDYNHSTFLDIVFASWFGIRSPELSTSDDDNPSSEQPWLVIHPLIRGAPHFAADRIPYRGRVLSIVYDPDGRHYSCQSSNCNAQQQQQRLEGLVILIDGNVVAQRSDLGRLEVPVEPS